MSSISRDSRTKARLIEQNEELRRRLEEAEQTIEAIRSGDVDALVVSNSHGEQIYTLTGAEHVYRVVVETMNEAALTVDLDGTILFCNQRFCDLMKTPMQETLGRSILGFAARPQQRPLESLMADAQAAPVQRRITLQAADGVAVPVQLSASLLHANSTTSICLVASDLTELEASANSIRILREHQQALEESESRFRTIFEASQDAIVITDDDGVYVQANPAVETIFDLSPKQLIGRRVSDFVGNAVDMLSIWQEFLATGSFHGEMAITGADGQVRFVDAYAVANILPGRHLAVLRDVTDRRRAEEALQEANGQLLVYTEELKIQAEELYAQTEELKVANEELHVSEQALRESEARRTVAMSAGGLGAWEADLVSGRTSWDEQLAILLGIAPEQRGEFSDAWMGFVHPDDRPRVREQLQAAIDGRTPYDTSFRMRRADGQERWFSSKGQVIRDASGAPVRMIGIAQDITERKRAEEALRESEEQYHRLFEDDLTGDFISTPEGQILLCNPAFAQMFGFSRAQDAVGTSILDLYVDPGEQALLLERLKHEGKIARFEGWRKRRDGKPIHIIENLVGHFNDQGELHEIKGYIFDDTERKLAEDALRESEERFRVLAMASSEALYRMSPDWSEMRQLRSRGFLAATEAPNRAWLQEYIHPDDQPRVAAIIQEAIRTKGVFEMEHRVWRADGSLGWTFSRAVPLMDASGEIVEWFGAASDVTERKQAEAALRESEERFRTMADGLPMIIWVTDAQGGIQFINRAYGDFFGVTLEQVRGPNWQPLVYPDDAPAYVGEFLASSRERRPFRAEVRVRRADGQWRWIASYGVPRFSQTGDFLGMVGGSPDVTDRRRAEESLRELTRTLETRVAERTRELEYRAGQLQKLALELSQAEDQERRRLAEILHDDLQQQLAAVKFHLGILSNRVKRDVAVQSSAAQLDRMLKDAIETSRNLSHELSPAVMYHGDMGEIFEWLAHQIQTKHGMIVHVDPDGQIDVQSDALKVFLFKAVQEMLFNAVKHARVGEARVRMRRRGRCICLCVSDRGRGFDPQELKQTAGFGLMSIRERIALLGGRMRIHSVKGVGSRFLITVPDAQVVGEPVGATLRGRPLEDRTAGESLASQEGGHGGPPLRVLIADDHEVVRHGLVSLLAEADDIELVGQAGNGREAVDMAYQLRPDVVIMDVAMPLMNGDEAARQIRRHLPQTRIVALSMYEEAGAVDRMHRAGAESYILKTAPSEELLAAVRGTK